jgi:hypothetical protein
MPQAGADSLSIPAADTGAAGFRFADPGETAAPEAPAPLHAPLFEGHRLPPGRLQPALRGDERPDWFLLAFLLAIAYFTTLRVLYGRVIRHLFGAFTNLPVTNQAVRDENLLMQRTSVLLSLLFYFSGGLFLYLVGDWFGWKSRLLGSGFQQFFLFTALLGAAYAVKLVLLKLLGFVAGAGKLVSYYIFNLFLANNMLGVALLPLIGCIAFAPEPLRGGFIYGALALAAACWLFRILRGVRAWFATPGYAPFYLILYLCVFELAPLIVIFKLV